MQALAGLMHRKSTYTVRKWPGETSDHIGALTARRILHNNGKSNVDLASRRVHVIALSVYLYQWDLSQLRHSGDNAVYVHIYISTVY